MQVNNRNIGSSTSISDNHTPIRKGDIGQVVIKERLNNHEAIVAIKGQEMKAKFDGPIPANDRIMAEVVSISDEGEALIKPLANNPSSNTNSKDAITQIMTKLGVDPSTQPQLKEALNLMIGKGFPISKETISTLQEFFKADPGTIDEKLATIHALVQRKIDITPTQLKAVHDALHGKPVSGELQKVLDRAGISIVTNLADKLVSSNPNKQQIHEIISQIRKQLKENPDHFKNITSILEKSNIKLPNDIKNEMLKATQIIEAGHSRKLTAPLDGAKLLQIGIHKMDSLLSSLIGEKGATNFANSENLDVLNIDPQEQAAMGLQKKFQSVLKVVQKESDINKVIQAAAQLLEELPNESLSSSIEKATQFTEQGRELAARKELTKAFVQMEQENAQLQQKLANPTPLTQAEQYYINEAIQSINLDSKNIIVTEISKMLSQLATDFKKMKQDITKNLDQFNTIAQSNKPVSPTQVKQLLESSIKQLDHAIMKGNYLLYTDMSTERKLLTASSQLAEAKNLIMKGNLADANQLVKDVKTQLEQMIFKPSDVRVKHFVAEQSMLLKEMHPPKQLAQLLQQAIQPFPEQDHSARQIFESVRRMGLTHESEVAHNLIGTTKGEHEVQTNLKSTLMKMIQLDEGQMKNTQPLEQALANLTGQQLLNKQDSSGIQNIFMQLPILLSKQVENVKVFINSQKKGEKIDWENCSLYFVLETKKLGDVGILVNANNRTLSITLKNDREQFAEKMEQFTEVSIERLKEVGYHVGSIQFKPFTQRENEKKNSGETLKEASQPTFTKKGYDYTI
jgi:hypothetical protein